MYVDSKSQMALFFCRYYKYNILFPNLSQKAKYFYIVKKWDLICHKSEHHVDDVIKTRDSGRSRQVPWVAGNL